MSAVEVEVISDPAGLERLAPEWWGLWRRAPNATPFQTPSWLVAWWRHFHPGELVTLTARKGGRLVGLAPVYCEDGALGRRLLPLGISLSDYHDLLLDPETKEEAAEALVSSVLTQPHAWDVWELEELREDAAALTFPPPDGCTDERVPQSACPVLALPSGCPSLSELLPKTRRRKVSMARHRAARRGTVAIEAADAGTVSETLEDLFRLHRARWQSRGEAGVLTGDAVLGFLREAIPGLQAAGVARLYRLRIGGPVVAVYCGFHDRGRAYAYANGFDPDYEFESPGALVLAHAIEQAIGEGAREFDFLRGQEPYKYEWGAVDRWNQHRRLTRR